MSADCVMVRRGAASHRAGATTIWFLWLFMALFAFAAIAVDVNYVVLTAQQLQVGADAAALAGAQYIRVDPARARTAAVNIARANFAAGDPIVVDLNQGNGPAGDVIVGVWDPATRQFLPTDDDPNAVRVTARRSSTSGGGPVQLLLGSSLGIRTADVVRTSIAYRPARDIVLVLDYSGSMNDDSSLARSTIDLRGRAAVENNLYTIWQQLGAPTYGKMGFEPSFANNGNANSIINSLNLHKVKYPYPHGSWEEYVEHVKSNSVDSQYRNRYGMMTFIDYLNTVRPSSNDTPDLYKTDAQPITAVKDAVTVFLNYLRRNSQSDQVGFVAYTFSDGTAKIEVESTMQLSRIEARSRAMQAGHYDSYTNISAGIEKGIAELDRNGRLGTNKLIVLLSDGIANRPSNESTGRTRARDRARDAARKEYRIATISLGVNADRDLMQQIADTTGGVHFNVPGTGTVAEIEQDLIEIFTSIARYQEIHLVN